MLAVLFLMGLQSTFFGPAKFGILPETLPAGQLSRGNGVVQMSTFAAIILGTALAGFAMSAWGGDLWMAGLPLVGIAVAGAAASLGIARTKASGATAPFRLNPWAEIGDGLRALRSDRTMWLSTLGTSYFWFLGALLQIVFLLYGTRVLQTSEIGVSLMLVAIAAGIGAGSLLAGRWSGDKVEIGLVPIGAGGMAAFLMALAVGDWSYTATLALLFATGGSAGLFIIPLESLLQQRSGTTERGRVMAAKNFLQTGAVLAASLTSWALLDAFGLSVRHTLAIAALFTVAATVYTLKTAPEFLIRFVLWLATHTVYRIRIEGREHIPARGPALLIANHVSMIDAFLIGGCIQRFIRFVVYKPYYESKLFKPVLSQMNAIPIQGGDPECVEQAVARARQELADGHLVCIFPEGMVTRTGELMPFKRGFERIVEGLDVPIVPIRLDGMWGSVFSFSGGRFFWKRPQSFPYPVTVTFGEALPATTTADEARTFFAGVSEGRYLGDDECARRISRSSFESRSTISG
jgi:acyl-[acyl-carrier-protein]-phospholipid O-acyltransferase/long-chain-fatty-acid--[acyl-carrier-protein] ligase